MAFYQGSGTDIENRTLDDLWDFTFKQKESAHNYIQWLFPSAVASQFNSRAPRLNPQLIDEMKSPEIQANLQKSLNKMLDFYGLEWDENHTEIKMADNFDNRAKTWLTKGNHNHLRLTRILICLLTFDLNTESAALFACLQEIKAKYPNQISDKTFKYWVDTQN